MIGKVKIHMLTRFNLRGKMLIMLLVPMLLILGGLCIYSYKGAYNALNTQIMQTTQYIVEYYSQKIDMSVNGKEAVADLAAMVLGGNELSDPEKLAFLQQAKASQTGIKSAFVGYEDKRYMDSDGITEKSKTDYDPRTRGWYKKAMAASGLTYTEVYETSQTKEPSVNIVKKIVRNGQVIGVVGIDVDINNLQEITKGIKIGETGYAAILDEKGNFLYHPQYKLTDNIAKIENGAMAEYSKAFMSGKPSLETGSFDGVEKMLASAPIGETGWVFVVSVPKAELFRQVKILGVNSLLASMVGLILLGVIIIMITLNLVKRINQVDKIAEKIADGDFTVDTASMLKTAPADEIGNLLKNFHYMSANLRKLIVKLASSAEQVAISAEQMTESSHQSAEASGSIAAAVTEVAQGTEEQVLAVHETSKVIESMSTGIEEVAATANKMAIAADQATMSTSDGQVTVDKAVNQMDNVGKGARQAQEAAKELESGSKQIGEIVELISSIAGQTNLLALNAAIEAARAGEQGRGFAVVAEEVRKLAEQSEGATKQIASLIEKNHQSIGNVVGAIDVAIEDVDQGIDLVHSAGDVFRKIAVSVTEVAGQVGDISASLQEISSGSQHIVASVQQIETVSQKASGEVQTVSAAVEEQSASMEEIASSSQTLAILAEELQGAVKQFKV